MVALPGPGDLVEDLWPSGMDLLRFGIMSLGSVPWYWIFCLPGLNSHGSRGEYLVVRERRKRSQLALGRTRAAARGERVEA